MSTPGQLDLVDERAIVVGDDWSLKLNFRNKVGGTSVDLSAYTFSGKLERQVDNGLTADMTVNTALQASGILVVSLDDSITAALDPHTRYEWHLRAVLGGSGRTWLKGNAVVIDP